MKFAQCRGHLNTIPIVVEACKRGVLLDQTVDRIPPIDEPPAVSKERGRSTG